MADISYFQNVVLEDGNDGLEDDYDRGDGQQGNGEHGAIGEGSQLTPMDRLFHHALSQKPAERSLVGKLLINIFQNAVKSQQRINIDEVFEPIEQIKYDTESNVRSSLVECLPHVALLCQEQPSLIPNENVIDRILNLVLTFISDLDNQVRKDAQTALNMLLEQHLLNDRQIQQDVCSFVVELSRDSRPELQALALTLMTQVSLYIGDKLTEKFFLDRFLELCKSEGFYVRRVCASIMGEFCTIMSKETVQNKLLSTYADLCLDSIWGVRKTSVDVMISVARCVPVSVRRQLLSKLLVRHLRDESRWVRRSAYEILGPFISTFAKQFYEIICDQKGELILIHEYKGGVPRFNVVPVAKVSDILIENLADVNSYYCKQTKPQDNVPTYKFQEKKMSLAKLLRKKILSDNDYKYHNQNVSDQSKLINDCKNANNDESENFNLFQYYYNPPDMPLDPELVKSIINDNDPPLNANEETLQTDNSNNENTNFEKTEEYEDSNKNIENNETETVDNKEHNKNYDNRQEISSDNNDNTVESTISEEVPEECSDSSLIEGEKQPTGKESFRRRLGCNSYFEELNLAKNNSTRKEEDDEEKEEEDSSENEQSKPAISVYSELTETMKLHSYESSENLDKTFEQSNSSMNLDDFEDDEEDGEIVPRILVDYFVSMSELKSNTVNDLGPEMDYHCAYSFPAIVLTLGRDNWHRLKDAYSRLASAVAWKVRSTLASSIHEIAIIIEKDYAARDLVPIYNGFIKDLDEVRIGALKHFSKFLKVLSPQDRTQYLPKLNDFLITDSKWNWRLKEELVHQLSKIIHYNLYKQTDIAEYISPLLLLLIQDRVAAVRTEAINVISQTLAYLDTYSDDSLSLAMIREIRDLLMAHAAERWSIRQTYPLICSTVMAKGSVEDKVFAKELLPYLLELADDKVPTVRLVVARTLVRDYYPYCYDPEIRNQVHQKLKMMQSDSDRDVREFANELED